ncbi:hypothetical protein [Pseudomonas synxantha]|uniref:hypothetical protein n=1 Tax=Pseudomonas synxantha TaxID=47883 RepID=UPI00345D228D
MNPDWSKAPQATHYTPGNPEEGLNAVYWRVIEGVTVKAWAVRSGGSIAECLSSCAFDLNRPDAIVKAWDGEGLPPVGMVCEWAGCTFAPEDPREPDLHIGDHITIIAHFKDGEFDLAAFTFNPRIHNHDRGTAWVNQGAHGCFRPIRTPEQIAADEREAGVEGIRRAVSKSPNCKAHGLEWDIACAIYDAGYRKQV